jgi:peptidoglycan/xylan/chitin deacetylase (PgdA/CDA1 family)
VLGRNLVLATLIGLTLIGLVIVSAVFLTLIKPHRSPATLLMYHSVTDEDGSPEPSVSRRLFRSQMAFLSAHGYETVFVRDVVSRYESARPVPSTWVALTFDGGYEDFARNVYPVLEQYGSKATLFVVVADVGTEGNVAWDQLRRMSRSGLVENGSHSAHHVADECLSPAQAWDEEARAKAALEANLGTPVVTYAYPFGAYSERAARMLQALGYRGAVGTVYRRNEFKTDDVFNLRRVYVSQASALPLMFRFMLSGYYVPTRALILRALNIRSRATSGATEASRYSGSEAWAASHSSRYFWRTDGSSCSANPAGRCDTRINSSTSARSRNRCGALIPDASFNSMSTDSGTRVTRAPRTPTVSGSGKRTGLGRPSPGYSPDTTTSIGTPCSVSRIPRLPGNFSAYPRPSAAALNASSPSAVNSTSTSMVTRR